MTQKPSYQKKAEEGSSHIYMSTEMCGVDATTHSGSQAHELSA
jgi:hypothetical protein